MPVDKTLLERVETLETIVRVADERIAKAVMLEVLDQIADLVVKAAVERIADNWEEKFLPALKEDLTTQIRELLDSTRS